MELRGQGRGKVDDWERRVKEERSVCRLELWGAGTCRQLWENMGEALLGVN